MNMSYNELNKVVTKGIQDYFFSKGKPEVLNRIGKNLIVFNFIQPDAAKEILLLILFSLRIKGADIIIAIKV